MNRLNVIVIVVALAVIAAVSARAEEGIMNGVAFKPLPVGGAIQVRPLDNSDDNLVLKADFEKALTARGFTVTDSADLILTFDTRDEIGAWSTTDRRHILSFEARGGRGGGEDAKARVNVFDSNSGGLLNQGRGETRISTPSQYRIDATIDVRSSGKRLWEGWSVAELGHSDSLSLTRKMVPVIVDALGRTVRRAPFPLY